MAIVELYSSRNKGSFDKDGDVYVYDSVPTKVLYQASKIINNMFGKYMYPNMFLGAKFNLYEEVNKSLCMEYGVENLASSFVSYSYEDDIRLWLSKSKDVSNFLDFIELSLRYAKSFIIDGCLLDESGKPMPGSVLQEAIDEINYRFKCARFGYQYIDSIITRVDSEFIHSEVVKPMLRLLNKTGGYDGAIEEFLSAHENYRHGKNKESINDCLKSFESLMKSIHLKRGWDFDSKRSTAKDLIASIMKNELIPPYLQAQYSNLNLLLVSGAPTIRNKESSHGQGVNVTNVENHLCSYMLNITASNLLFLAECEQSL